MPLVSNSTKRRQLSELVKGYTRYNDEAGVNFSWARVNVEGTAAINPIGQPLVWDATESAFVVYDAQNISAVTGSPLPDEAPICVTIGQQEGRGINKADVTLSSTAVQFTVLFRGPATVLTNGFDWASTSTANQNEFYAQLEKQEVSVDSSATSVTPSFTSA